MPSIRPGHLLVAIVALFLTGVASAQRAGQPNPRYLERKNPKGWIMDVDVVVRACDNSRSRDRREPFESGTFNISQAAVVFPMAMTSASHDLNPRKTRTSISFDDQDMGVSPRMEAQFPAGANYAIWQIDPPGDQTIQAREMQAHAALAVTAYETVFHEDAAREVPWPQKNWPDVAQSTFLNTPYLDFQPGAGPQGVYDKAPVQDLLRRWTNGQDPRSIPPVVLAKWLAGQVMVHVQISGQGKTFSRRGAAPNVIEGIQLQPPPITARRRRGTPFDAALLLCAVYREAGLPARVVIGFGFEDEDDKELEFLKGNAEQTLQAWVEFCLYDERDGTVTWIPVDIVRMKRSLGNRLLDNYMDRPQKYFGTHDQLDNVVPFSFHFFPPTTVRSYSAANAPGFWGWFVAPTPPECAYQTIRFNLKSASTRGG